MVDYLSRWMAERGVEWRVGVIEGWELQRWLSRDTDYQSEVVHSSLVKVSTSEVCVPFGMGMGVDCYRMGMGLVCELGMGLRLAYELGRWERKEQ